MISFFRRIIGSKVGAAIGIAFLALVAFAFAAGDVSNNGGIGSFSFFGGTGTKVGGRTLTEAEVTDRVQRVFEQQRRETPGLQIGDFLAQGPVPQIYDQLIGALALEDFAQDQGVFVSKRMVDARIASIPAFQDASGKFSQETFRQLLSAQGLSEKALREDLQREMTAQMIAGPAGFGSRLPDSIVLPYASLLLEARKGRIAAIPSAAFKPDRQPTDAELQQFYTRNAERYSIPERRKLRYAVVDAERFSTAAQPSEADVAKYYASRRADYAARETRTVDQLILPTESAAKAAATSGSLAQAAKANGLSVATLAEKSKAALTSETSADAANRIFAAPQGQLVGPVRIALGWALYETRAVQKVAERPLAAVRGEIVETLRTQKRAALLADFVSKVEDEIANGATFDEAAKDNGLAVKTTPALLATGQNPDDPAYRPDPEVTAVLKSGFDMEADDDPQFAPVVPEARYALVDVTDIVAAAPPPLARVKPIVTQQYLLNLGAAKARTLADRLAAQVRKGTPLDKALASAGVPLPPAQTVAGRRADLLRGDRSPPAEISILFAMARGTVKTMPIPNDQGMFLIMLDDIQQGDAARVPGLVDRVRGDMASFVGVEYATQFQRAVERDIGVRRKAATVPNVTRELRRINGAAPAAP